MTVGHRKLRIEFDRAVEQAQRFGRGLLIAVLIKLSQPPQVGGIGIENLSVGLYLARSISAISTAGAIAPTTLSVT